MLKEGTYNEEEVIRALAGGSAAAFDAIYMRYYEAVRANIRKIVREEMLVDDILQEVFLSLWNKRAEFGGKDRINGWLFVASYNRSINVLKRITSERLYKRSVQDTSLEWLGSDPEMELIQERQYQLVEAAIGLLPTQRRRVFELCRLEGKTYAQAAAALAISKNTVKDHLGKASDFIRGYVGEHMGDPGALSFCIFLGLAGDIIFL